METIEIVLCVALAAVTGLCYVQSYTLKKTIEVMKMTSENSTMFYKALVEERAKDRTTNVTNVVSQVMEDIDNA